MEKRESPAWDAIKAEAVFLMRGTIRELCETNLEHFDKKGKEYIFAPLPVEEA